MQIHLQHPLHGVKSTSLEAEARWDERHGWLRYNPTAVSGQDEGLTPNRLSRYSTGTQSAAPQEVSSKTKGLK
jgi:hypothetical protein